MFSYSPHEARGMMATRARAAIILIIELIKTEKEKVCGWESVILLSVHLQVTGRPCIEK